MSRFPKKPVRLQYAKPGIYRNALQRSIIALHNGPLDAKTKLRQVLLIVAWVAFVFSVIAVMAVLQMLMAP